MSIKTNLYPFGPTVWRGRSLWLLQKDRSLPVAFLASSTAAAITAMSAPSGATTGPAAASPPSASTPPLRPVSITVPSRRQAAFSSAAALQSLSLALPPPSLSTDEHLPGTSDSGCASGPGSAVDVVSVLAGRGPAPDASAQRASRPLQSPLPQLIDGIPAGSAASNAEAGAMVVMSQKDGLQLSWTRTECGGLGFLHAPARICGVAIGQHCRSMSHRRSRMPPSWSGPRVFFKSLLRSTPHSLVLRLLPLCSHASVLCDA